MKIFFDENIFWRKYFALNKWLIFQLQHPVKYWSPVIPVWQSMYAIYHFALVLIFRDLLSTNHHSMPQTMVTFCIIALLISITSIGFLLENRKFAPHFEILRCISFLYFSHKFIPLMQSDLKLILHTLLNYSFIFSSILFLIVIIFNLKQELNSSLVFGIFEKMNDRHRKISLKWSTNSKNLISIFWLLSSFFSNKKL